MVSFYQTNTVHCGDNTVVRPFYIHNGISGTDKTSLYWCVVWIELYQQEIVNDCMAWSIQKTVHDDVIKWKHFPCYWPFVWGIHRSSVNSPHKGQWRGALMFSLICARINGWVNNRDVVDLWRYRAHYDVIVMVLINVCHWYLSIVPHYTAEARSNEPSTKCQQYTSDSSFGGIKQKQWQTSVSQHFTRKWPGTVRYLDISSYGDGVTQVYPVGFCGIADHIYFHIMVQLVFHMVDSTSCNDSV